MPNGSARTNQRNYFTIPLRLDDEIILRGSMYGEGRKEEYDIELD